LISGLLLETGTERPRCKVRSRPMAVAVRGRMRTMHASRHANTARRMALARHTLRERFSSPLAHDGEPLRQLERRHGRDGAGRGLRVLPPDLVHWVLHVRRVGRQEYEVPPAVVPRRRLLARRDDPFATGLVLEHA